MAGTKHRYPSSSSLLAAVCVMLMLQACGSSRMATPTATNPQLNEAIARWDNCVLASIETTGVSSATEFSARCEGHRRDVAARYPRHLESEIHAQLKANEQKRLLDHSNPEFQDASFEEAIRRVAKQF